MSKQRPFSGEEEYAEGISPESAKNPPSYVEEGMPPDPSGDGDPQDAILPEEPHCEEK